MLSVITCYHLLCALCRHSKSPRVWSPVWMDGREKLHQACKKQREVKKEPVVTRSGSLLSTDSGSTIINAYR